MHRYYIEAKHVAEGGYSKIFPASDQYGTRYIAKVLAKPDNDLQRVRLHNELAVGKQLSNYPKFVKQYDAYETPTSVVIVQELCRGGTAIEYLRFHESTENTVASITRGALRGLAMCHDIGIVHKDIKPLNILQSDISVDSETKICDFGLSRFLSPVASMNATPSMEGTPAFLSPEMLRCEFSKASDVWALGVSVYYMISGRLPFLDRQYPSAPRQAALFRSILGDELVFRGSSWDGVSEACKDFVRRCLTRDVSERPSAEELLDHPWISEGTCATRFTGDLLKTKYRYEVEDLRALTM